MNKDKSILVTGAGGLIGNRVRLYLEEQGRTVVPIDQVSATEEGRPLIRVGLNEVHRLHAVMRDHDVGGIVHCAAFSGPMVSADNPTAMVDVNIVGTANMLELARIYGDIRVVNCSSSTAYGPAAGEDISEDTPLSPTTVYAATKAAGEHLAGSYFAQFGVDAVSIRLGWVFGPRRTTDCIIKDMIVGALLGRKTTVDLDPETYRQYMYVDDAARALIAALDAPAFSRRVYNATGDSHLTVAQVADAVRAALPSADIEVAAATMPDDDVQGRFSCANAARDLGYVADVSFEEGLRRYSDWLASKLPA